MEGKNKLVVLALFLLVNLLFVGLIDSVEAQAAGEGIFQQNCSGCHTIGGGDTVGPDLKGVADRREKAWLLSYIRGAADMKAKGDPVAAELAQNWSMTMPNTGLTEDEAAAVIAYLENQTGTDPAAPAQTEPLPEGNAAFGRDLFVGAKSFSNGGGACIACHNTEGIGTFGGGSLGPNLSKSFTALGETGLVAVLSASPSPFPTMKPIYDNQPLTMEEVAHLVSYLEASAQEQPKQGGAKFAAFGFGGTLVLLVLGGVIWQGRNKNIRQLLLEEAYKS